MDVIVNSTNLKLDLKKGFVSSAIFEKGGKGIKDELTNSYPHGIMFGDIAITSGNDLRFKKIFHGALYKKWISTGNFSLKVCKSTVILYMFLIVLTYIYASLNSLSYVTLGIECSETYCFWSGCFFSVI